MKTTLTVVLLTVLLALALPGGTALAQEPAIKCGFGSCTATGGLTDDMIAAFLTKDGNFENKSLTLNAVTDADLQKLPALKDALETLVFWEKGDGITDLAPLAGLPRVKKVQLRECKNLADLTPLAEMTALESLELYNLPQAADLGAVGNIPTLKSLTLTNLAKPIDLTPLSNLAGLTELRINQGVPYTSFEFLAGLENLEKAYFLAEPADVIDIAPLGNKPKLKELTFSQAKIADLSPLAGAAELTRLALNGSAASDLSPLAGLKKLKTLELVNLKAEGVDLTPVGALAELTALDVSGSSFAGFAPLGGLAKLESFQARERSNFGDLGTLAGLTGLKRLSLWANAGVEDWAGLAPLTALESLQLGKTGFGDMGLLKGMASLKELGLQECKLTGFDQVAPALPSLTNLNITGAQGVSDLTVMTKAPQLAKLLVTYKQGQFPQEQVDAFKAAQEAKKKG